MGWLIFLIFVYFVIGAAIIIFYIHSDTLDLDKETGKAWLFIDYVGVLFWPIYLFMEMNRRRKLS